jgi:flagella basal body P-ring formation protein FlgA
MVLGDIARIEPSSSRLAGIPIGYAPYPGNYRWLEKADVENYLRKWGLSETARVEMSDRVLIVRESQFVDSDRISRSIQEYLSTVHPEFEFQIQQILVPQDVVLPEGNVEIEVQGPRTLTRINGLSLKVDFLVDGKRHKSQWVQLEAKAIGDVVVLNHDVRYGQPIRREDLRIERRELNRLEGLVHHPEDAVGNVPKTALREGDELLSRNLKEPMLVRRGDVVSLLAKGSRFVVKTLAKAKDSGTRGELIMVENVDSKQLVQAMIVGPKTVSVLLPEVSR